MRTRRGPSRRSRGRAGSSVVRCAGAARTARTECSPIAGRNPRGPAFVLLRARLVAARALLSPGAPRARSPRVSRRVAPAPIARARDNDLRPLKSSLREFLERVARGGFGRRGRAEARGAAGSRRNRKGEWPAPRPCHPVGAAPRARREPSPRLPRSARARGSWRLSRSLSCSSRGFFSAWSSWLAPAASGSSVAPHVAEVRTCDPRSFDSDEPQPPHEPAPEPPPAARSLRRQLPTRASPELAGAVEPAGAPSTTQVRAGVRGALCGPARAAAPPRTHASDSRGLGASDGDGDVGAAAGLRGERTSPRLRATERQVCRSLEAIANDRLGAVVAMRTRPSPRGERGIAVSAGRPPRISLRDFRGRPTSRPGARVFPRGPSAGRNAPGATVGRVAERRRGAGRPCGGGEPAPSYAGIRGIVADA